MTPEIKNDIKGAVCMAVRYWPNAHLGDLSPRQDIRSAFRLIRSRLSCGWTIQSAISDLEADAYRHVNM